MNKIHEYEGLKIRQDVNTGFVCLNDFNTQLKTDDITETIDIVANYLNVEESSLVDFEEGSVDLWIHPFVLIELIGTSTENRLWIVSNLLKLIERRGKRKNAVLPKVHLQEPSSNDTDLDRQVNESINMLAQYVDGVNSGDISAD